jgi:hypothetical protein
VAPEKACSDCAEFESPVLGAIVRKDHPGECKSHDFQRRRCVNHDVVADEVYVTRRVRVVEVVLGAAILHNFLLVVDLVDR